MAALKSSLDASEANFERFGRGLLESDVRCERLFCGRIDYSKHEGCVVANEISADRAGMLVHQIARRAVE